MKCKEKAMLLRHKVIAIIVQSAPLYHAKVHIKYEKRKNAAIKLSIKDLKGLWKAA